MEKRWGETEYHLDHVLTVHKDAIEIRLVCETCNLELYHRSMGRYGVAPVPEPIPYKPPRGKQWESTD